MNIIKKIDFEASKILCEAFLVGVVTICFAACQENEVTKKEPATDQVSEITVDADPSQREEKLQEHITIIINSTVVVLTGT